MIVSLTLCFLLGTCITVLPFWLLFKSTKLKNVVMLKDLEKSREIALIKLENAEKNNLELNDEIKNLRGNLQIEIAKRSRLERENEILQQTVQDSQGRNDEAMAIWKAEIENRTNNFVAEKSKKFEQHLEERLLNPLRQNIDHFKRDMQNSFKENSKEQGQLKEMLDQRVKDMLIAKDGIVSQAENLVNVFKKDYKSQGNWGELILEKVLEDSGLKKDVHYRVQPTLQNEDGNAIRPDIIIDLPKNKHIIIDSKVSLVYCEKFCSEVDAQKKERYRREFISNIRKQIDDLSAKHYQHAKSINSPDFVLMFIPIEPAYSLVMSCDENLHTYAWNNKRIALVSVSNIMIAISVINRILSIECQNQNVEKIVQEAQKLYDKFVLFLENMEQIGMGLKKSTDLFTKAMNQLSAGRKDSIIGRIENLRSFGVVPTKKINSDERYKAISPYIVNALENLEEVDIQ